MKKILQTFFFSIVIAFPFFHIAEKIRRSGENNTITFKKLEETLDAQEDKEPSVVMDVRKANISGYDRGTFSISA